jgi:hypothetical protein
MKKIYFKGKGIEAGQEREISQRVLLFIRSLASDPWPLSLEYA